MKDCVFCEHDGIHKTQFTSITFYNNLNCTLSVDIIICQLGVIEWYSDDILLTLLDFLFGYLSENN